MRRYIHSSKGSTIGVVCGTEEECDKFESTWNEVKMKYGDTLAISYMVNNFKV